MQILAWGFLALTAFSFLGAWNPLADSFAVLRPIWWFFAALGTFILGQNWQVMARLALVIMAVPFYVLFDDSRDFDDPALRLFQHNLLYTSTAPDLDMIMKQLSPDVLTVQEIKDAKPTLDKLADYPHQKICDYEAVGDIGILSRFEILESGCATGNYRGFAWARIQNDVGEEATIVSMHLHWPYPYAQSKQLQELIPQLQELPRPIVLAGDLNQVPWSHAIRAIADAIDAPILPGLRFTLVRPPLFLPIDHVYGEGTHNIEKLDRYGSDHNALLADFEEWPTTQK